MPSKPAMERPGADTDEARAKNDQLATKNRPLGHTASTCTLHQPAKSRKRNMTRPLGHMASTKTIHQPAKNAELLFEQVAGQRATETRTCAAVQSISRPA